MEAIVSGNEEPKILWWEENRGLVKRPSRGAFLPDRYPLFPIEKDPLISVEG